MCHTNKHFVKIVINSYNTLMIVMSRHYESQSSEALDNLCVVDDTYSPPGFVVVTLDYA